MSQIPEGMTLDEWTEHRMVMENHMQDVANALARMYDYWMRLHLPGDFLDADKGEYPFTLSLDDFLAEVDHAAEVIRENTDNATTDTED